MVNTTGIGEVAGKSTSIGVGTGDVGIVVGKFASGFSLFLGNTSLVEWVLLGFVGVGGVVVWHLKRKYGIKFRFWGKKRKPKEFL